MIHPGLTVVDSHTGGELTRVVVAGAPLLTAQSLADRREELRREHDWLRCAVINEPRGSDVMVGALLCPPTLADCDLGVIFFNNTGYLNMCGHGTIGLAATLVHLGRAQPGQTLRLETPVGVVKVAIHDCHTATIANVPSYRRARAVPIHIPGHGTVHGDIAWGGNWFFLMEDHGLAVRFDNIPCLMDFCLRAKQTLVAQGLTGDNGMEIDHIELFAPAREIHADSRNFVFCPGGAYDRSPCGTGTSAKLACLHADGKLAAGQKWRQASILGSVFEGEVHVVDGQVIPHITGTAYVTGETKIILNPADPFRHGITAASVR